MEVMRRHIAMQPTPLAAYLALESALMRRFLARGGTVEEFCERLAPTYHRRYAPVILGEAGGEPIPIVAAPANGPTLER